MGDDEPDYDPSLAYNNSSYDYDYNNSSYDYDSDCDIPDYDMIKTVNLVVGGYVTLVVAVLGVFANILAITVFCRKSFRSNFNNLLIALASFDLLFLVISFTEAIRNNFGDPDPRGSSRVGGLISMVHVLLFPHFIYPLANILLTCSVFMTVSISIERYLAIFRPLVYKNRTSTWNVCCHIIPVIFFAILINLPKFFESKVVFLEVDGKTLPTISVQEWRFNPHYTMFYLHWTRFLLLGLVPMLTLLVLNGMLFKAISIRKTMSNEASYSNILLLIVLIFVICHTPRLALNMYEVLDMQNIEDCGPPFWAIIIYTVSNTLLTINSALNFFIYFLAGSKFRRTLLTLLSCQKVDSRASTLKRNTVVSKEYQLELSKTSSTGVRGESAAVKLDTTFSK